MNFSYKNSDSGFTLIEVLISLFLLILISLAIFQATTQTYRIRETLVNEGDFHNGVRLSMGILERDISQLFSPITLLPPKTGPAAPVNPADAEALATGDLSRTTQFWTGAIDKSGLRPSRFVGSDNKLSFVTNSHIRVYKDAPESEFEKVVYEMRPEKSEIQSPEGKVLTKIADTNVFDDESRKDTWTHTYPLLHGVKKLKFRYYRKDKKSWETSWDSDKDDLKNKYPDMIEVSIEVVGPSRMFFEGTFIFRPEVPFNGLDPST